MPFETRKGKGAYFTATVRAGKKPWRLYFGRAGTVPAELASVIVAIHDIHHEMRRRANADGSIHNRNVLAKKRRQARTLSPEQIRASVDAMQRSLLLPSEIPIGKPTEAGSNETNSPGEPRADMLDPRADLF